MAKYTLLAEVPAELKERLSNYFTNIGGDTFVIQGLPPELTGGALARYSRAATGMQLTIINEFLDEQGFPSQQKGSALMDRVLNAYGDDSVGELEGAHVGIENISQLATKGIEDRRIGGSPIEQSTRYVRYDQKDEQGRWRYLRPTEIEDAGLMPQFEQVNDRAFEVYAEGIRRLSDFFKKEFPREKFKIQVQRGETGGTASESELENAEERKAFNTAYNFTIRCAALDVGRCVLPSSTLTHLGVFGNGRFFTNIITYLKSSELAEERARGQSIEVELNKVIPTFIKRNKINPELTETNKRMRALGKQLFNATQPEAGYVTLLPEAPYQDQIIASSVFPYTNLSLRQLYEEVGKMSQERKTEMLAAYTGKRESRRNRSGRGLEAGYPLTFDLVGGFAEYRDLERHRILTQQRQLLGTSLGFILPPEITIVGLEKEVLGVEEMMSDLNRNIQRAGVEVASQYATLFNHRLRFMMGMNLREFQHLSELRTQQAGHFSYRAMVQEMARQVTKKYPWAEAVYGFVDYSDPGNKISRAKEQSKIAGKNLTSGIDSSVDLR